MSKDSLFLLLGAAGLTPVALSYGLSPAYSMDLLFEIDASAVNSAHIFRAVMGLYLAMVVFWIFGALREPLRLPALWSLAVFMLGLAAGRFASLLIDGMPHPMLMLYLVLEIGFGATAVYFIKQRQAGSV